jgi:hypothetical protein
LTAVVDAVQASKGLPGINDLVLTEAEPADAVGLLIRR